jgi:hypothetical protein
LLVLLVEPADVGRKGCKVLVPVEEEKEEGQEDAGHCEDTEGNAHVKAETTFFLYWGSQGKEGEERVKREGRGERRDVRSWCLLKRRRRRAKRTLATEDTEGNAHVKAETAFFPYWESERKG